MGLKTQEWWTGYQVLPEIYAGPKWAEHWTPHRPTQMGVESTEL